MNSTSQQAAHLRASIHTLLNHLEAYRAADPEDFENIEDWVEGITDLNLCDAVDVLMAVSFYLF